MAERKHRDAVTKLRSADVRIGFSEKVQGDFEKLFHQLKGMPGFDEETVEHLHDLASGKFQNSIPVAFAAVTQIFKEITTYAVHTGSLPLLEDLENLKSDLSSYGDEKNPIKIFTVNRTR